MRIGRLPFGYPSDTTLLRHVIEWVAQKHYTHIYARCTRSELVVWYHEKFESLLSWWRAFDVYKHDSNRAIFDVDIQVWKWELSEAFFKSWDFDVLQQASTKLTLVYSTLFSRLAKSSLTFHASQSELAVLAY
jgi:hypothetical protein